MREALGTQIIVAEKMIEIAQTVRRLIQSPSVRAVLMLSVSMVMAVVVGTLALLVDLRQQELTHARGETISLNRILAEQTTRTIDGVALAMYGARDRISDKVGRDLALDSTPVHLLLQSRIIGLPQVKSMFVADSKGMVVNSSRDDLASPFSVAQREFFQYFSTSNQDGLFVSLPERARIDGQWTFYLAVRLLNSDGSFRGVIASAISIEYFESLYDSINLDFVSKIQLLSRHGELMAGHRTGDSAFGERVLEPDSLSRIAGHPEHEVVLSNHDAMMEPWISTYRQVAKYPLIVSAAVSEHEALTPWRRVALPIATGAVAVIVFILLATTIILKNLLRKEHLQLERDASNEKLRHMVQSVRDAILTVDSSQNIVLFNSAAEQLLGVRATDVLDQNIEQFLLRSQPKIVASNLLGYLREAWQSPSDLALLGIVSLVRDDQDIPVELSLSSTTVRGERLVTAVFRDLSERQRTELELLKSNRQLQELTASLESVREQERLRISRELHDELGQALTGLRMEISWLGGRLLTTQPELEQKVVSIKKLIDGTIKSVRRISSELRPLVLDDLGFAAAANWYVDQFATRTNLKVALELPNDDPENGGTVATTLFRVLQESLTNVARHAGARNVDIRLLQANDQWRLEIRDDGQGFDQSSAKMGGIGLIGMRERVQALGGSFELTAAPGQGTLIEICIPVESARKG